jgi:hypothetical protein
MNIITGKCENISGITEYFDFNQISYTPIDLWEATLDQFGRYTMNHPLLQESNTLLVINFDIFFKIYNWNYSRQQLIKFCKSNKLWVWDDVDGLLKLISDHARLTILDACVESASIHLFIDSKISNHHAASKFNNIQINVMPCDWCFRNPRIQNAVVDKINCSRDFMLTTVKKASAPHRDILWNQLNTIDGLIECGHVNYGSGKKRVGQQSHQHGWGDGHPSMDLYRDSWLEIVPETLYRDGYIISEKTAKSIATKTPFLAVSTRFYLEHLQQRGFQTFGSIIDESYDRQPRVEDRVRLMLVQLQDIIRNGSEAFYKECASVLEHNQNRFFEIAGRKHYDLDIFIAKHLEQLGIK